MTEQTITREATGHLLPPPEQHATEDGGLLYTPADPVPVQSWWSWSGEQPYLLRLDIGQDLTGARWVTWEIARDLVQMGLVSAEPVGEGDVTLWSTDVDLHVQLDSPSGAAWLRWDRTQVSAVLAESLQQQPNGADAPTADAVEDWLEAITHATGPGQDDDIQ